MNVKFGQAKYQPSTPKGTFSNWGLNGPGIINVRFPTENWPYLGNGER